MIRFGIVGLGVIANTHIQALGEIPDAVVAGVFDRSRERTEAIAAELGARAYRSYSAMLADENIDAVCICTPSGFHADQAVQALREGKHVVLEKPMALNTADAERVCREAEINHRLLTVIFQSRFSEDVMRLKEMIRMGKLGRLTLCDLYMKFWREPSYYKSGAWRGTWLMDGGGALMNQGIHGVDLMRYLLGEVTLLRGCARTMVHDIEVEDTAVALVEYSTGGMGVIEASTATYPGYSRRIEIHGSLGYAVLVNFTLEKLFVNGEMLIDRVVETDVGLVSDPTRMNHEGHLRQLCNFVAAINEREALRVTARDGYEAVRLIEEIYDSSNNNKSNK